MTKFEEGLVQDYKAHLSYIERTVASVHGILTKNDIDRRDSLENQLINRGLSRYMSVEAVQNYHYHRNIPS